MMIKISLVQKKKNKKNKAIGQINWKILNKSSDNNNFKIVLVMIHFVFVIKCFIL